MEIQYISDLHLEFYNKIENIPIIPSAPILCLAGDIGYPDTHNFDIFLQWCSLNFKKTFLVSGNHEYYNNKFNIEEINNIIEDKVSKFYNISFLNRKIEIYNGYTFIGCTLWSDIPSYVRDYDLFMYNDFHKIKSFNRELYVKLHKQDLDFLIKAFSNHKNIICITHHLPTFKLIHEKYKDDSYENFMFGNNLEYLFNNNIKAWICGHTHASMFEVINNVICATNPYGYPEENDVFEIISKKLIV